MEFPCTPRPLGPSAMAKCVVSACFDPAAAFLHLASTLAVCAVSSTFAGAPCNTRVVSDDGESQLSLFWSFVNIVLGGGWRGDTFGCGGREAPLPAGASGGITIHGLGSQSSLSPCPATGGALSAFTFAVNTMV
jgi:hypothetical protein